MSRSERKVAIIGGGPAGIGAAQQCAREGIDDTIILEKDRLGGLVYYANRVDNNPGCHGKSGREVVDELKMIIERYSLEVRYTEVESISSRENVFGITLGGKETLTAKYVIIATGTEAKTLCIPDEITYPPWRDYSDENVLIVGGGDAAFDYSLRLDRLGGDVTIMRRSSPIALESLVQEVRSNDIEEIHGKILEWGKKSNKYIIHWGEGKIKCDTLVTAIGRRPRKPKCDFFFDSIDIPTGRTDTPNLYAIGSLVLGKFRQTSLCWGMGIATGMSIAEKEK